MLLDSPQRNMGVSAYQPLSLLTRTTLSRCWVMLQQESGERCTSSTARRLPSPTSSRRATIAICDPDMEVRDGSVALVGVNGDEATIKRVFFAGNTIVLHAESTMADEYPDIAINTKDPASPPVHLIGEIFWKTLPARPIKF